MTGLKYRGAVVEDLQLAPAFCLESSAHLSEALEAAFEREFDYLPILNEQRRPVGYLDVKAILRKHEEGQAKEDDIVETHTTFFRAKGPKSNSISAASSSSTTALPPSKYQTIHPLTPLEELEAFFRPEATGATGSVTAQSQEFALVTDLNRKWVIAVASRADLETFVKKRGFAEST